MSSNSAPSLSSGIASNFAALLGLITIPDPPVGSQDTSARRMATTSCQGESLANLVSSASLSATTLSTSEFKLAPLFHADVKCCQIVEGRGIFYLGNDSSDRSCKLVEVVSTKWCSAKDCTVKFHLKVKRYIPSEGLYLCATGNYFNYRASMVSGRYLTI